MPSKNEKRVVFLADLERLRESMRFGGRAGDFDELSRIIRNSQRPHILDIPVAPYPWTPAPAATGHFVP